METENRLALILEEENNMKLDIYKVVDGTDQWPLVEIIEANTEAECIEIAENKYGQDEYHWANCY